MKIVTWNINGVRARIENLCAWLKESDPDIVCLQEIKSVDENFPRLEIEALAIMSRPMGRRASTALPSLSKVSPDEVTRGLPG